MANDVQKSGGNVSTEKATGALGAGAAGGAAVGSLLGPVGAGVGAVLGAAAATVVIAIANKPKK